MTSSKIKRVNASCWGVLGKVLRTLDDILNIAVLCGVVGGLDNVIKCFVRSSQLVRRQAVNLLRCVISLITLARLAAAQ